MKQESLKEPPWGKDATPLFQCDASPYGTQCHKCLHSEIHPRAGACMSFCQIWASGNKRPPCRQVGWRERVSSQEETPEQILEGRKKYDRR